MKHISRIFLLLGILLSIVLKYHSQVHLSWFNKVQHFQAWKGYYVNPSPILSKVPFTGTGWGIYLPTGWDISTLQLEIEEWHSRNKIYMFNTSTIRLLNDNITSIPDSHRLIDLYGNYVNRPADTRQYTIFSKPWRNLLINAVKEAIDLGADGIQIDDVLVSDMMLPFNLQPASFDSLTMIAFRDYLKDSYSNHELLVRFGISNIDTFHYGKWIKTNGQELTWNQQPLKGLASEFYKFLHFESKKFISELVTYAHNYALDNYEKQFVVSCNPTFYSNGYFLLDKVDYLLAEHFTFETHSPFAHTDIKAIKAVKNWPVVVIPEPKKSNLPKNTRNMIKLIIADIYSVGGLICFGEALSDGLSKPIQVDFDIYGRYMNFIISNRTFYENLVFRPQVAILNSMASRNAKYWQIEGDIHLDWQSALWGTGLLMTDSNIQFDVIFGPDSRFSSLPSFTLTQLQRYKVVVLPHTFALSDDQVQTLLDYVQGGGIIFAMGNIGTNNPDGTFANRQTLISLQQNNGVKSFGAGKFVYDSLSLGEAYLWDWGIPHAEVRQRFQSIILPYIKLKIKTNNVQEVFRPGGATGFIYQDQYGKYILHLVNYDYNEYTDEIAVKENITLKIFADNTKEWKAVYISPDFYVPQILSTTNDSGYVNMMIPRLEVYGIVILTTDENDKLPTVLITNPSDGETVHGKLSIQTDAKDDIGISKVEFYIDGQKLSEEPGNQTCHQYEFRWDSNSYSDGNHKIKVIAYDIFNQTNYHEISVTLANIPPAIGLNKTQFVFGAIANGTSPNPQSFMIRNSGGGTLNWLITDDQNWLSLSPISGTNLGFITISIDPSGLSEGAYTGTITVKDPNAFNSPQTVKVILNVYRPGATSEPFGEFATPGDNSIVMSSIPVTGWVLDDIGVESVKIYRGEVGNLIYIGDAVLVEGARPDVEQAYPHYPMNYKAGWGYMMLTNFLPNGGNGTFKLHAIASDIEGNKVTLGTKTIICDNAQAVKPFGAIDTPTQGGTASGNSFINWGWALTPQPNYIPTDGSTIKVYVDGVNIGHPTYNNYRKDIATLFPNYANSNGAIGYFYLDTTAYENGVHTIQWTAADSAGNSDGIGSRYFTIQNTGTNSGRSLSNVQWTSVNDPVGKRIFSIPGDKFGPVIIEKGFNRDTIPREIHPDENGDIHIKIRELERVMINLGCPQWRGYHIIGDQLRPLPIGSTLDTEKGIFYWQPGPGFIGEYQLVFIVREENGELTKKTIKIIIAPKFKN